MAKRKPSKIVVDASVARASGREDATYPTSIRCCQFLKAFQECEFLLVMSPEIELEWNQHKSHYASKWIVQMYGRKRVVNVGNVNDTHLRERIRNTSKIKKEQQAMEKDCRLLEAALATDQRIVSLDKTVRKLFRHAAKAIREIQSIVWVNTDNEDDDAVNWLKNGARAEKKRQLRNMD